MSDIIIIGTWE